MYKSDVNRSDVNGVKGGDAAISQNRETMPQNELNVHLDNAKKVGESKQTLLRAKHITTLKSMAV